MNYINTNLFVQEPLGAPIGRSNTELLRLITQSRQAQQTAPFTGNPVLRMRWVCTNDEKIRSILRARWQIE